MTDIPTRDAVAPPDPHPTAEAVDHLKVQVRQSADRLVGETRRAFGDAKAVAELRLEQGQGMIEQRPILAVGTALLAGLIIGSLLRSRRPQVIYQRPG